MKAVVILLSVLNAVLALNPIPYDVRNISNESIRADVETRIYGGTEAREGQFPFMVFVMMKHYNNYISQCSASLLDSSWVLLAAHCVNILDLKPKNILVAGGKANLKDYVKMRVQNYDKKIDDETLGLQERRAKRFLINPNYNYSSLAYDVALIELERPFILNSLVRKIFLSDGFMVSPKNCTILGWGLTLGNVQNFKLNYVEKKTVKTTRHGCMYKHYGPFICLLPDHRGICQGDSGSPLVCHDEVWGVASHFVSAETNPDCGNSAEEYYSEVSECRVWIRDQIYGGGGGGGGGGNSGFKSAVINSKSFLVCAVALLWSAKCSIKI